MKEKLTPIYAIEYCRRETVWPVQELDRYGIYRCISFTEKQAIQHINELKKDCVWGRARHYGFKERGFRNREEKQKDLIEFGALPEHYTDYR